MECLFCKIANKEIDATVIYENEQLIAFNDIKPQAPIHKLIIPKQHIATLNDLKEKDIEIVGSLILTAKKIAANLDVAEAGYRLLFNCNRNGGQDVFHIHLHLLAGRAMQWPPG